MNFEYVRVPYHLAPHSSKTTRPNQVPSNIITCIVAAGLVC